MRFARPSGTRAAGGVAAAMLAAALAPAAPAATEDAAPRDFEDWISGDWIDPRVHRCDTVWVRIEAGKGRIRVYTVTFGNEVLATESALLGLGDGDGRARLWSPIKDRAQQIRYVTPDAHVLERTDGVGGVTFVRCPAEAG